MCIRDSPFAAPGTTFEDALGPAQVKLWTHVMLHVLSAPSASSAPSAPNAPNAPSRGSAPGSLSL
eukprot:8520639-Alexandrium_andersonii.AAC.1